MSDPAYANEYIPSARIAALAYQTQHLTLNSTGQSLINQINSSTAQFKGDAQFVNDFANNNTVIGVFHSPSSASAPGLNAVVFRNIQGVVTISISGVDDVFSDGTRNKLSADRSAPVVLIAETIVPEPFDGTPQLVRCEEHFSRAIDEHFNVAAFGKV